MAEREVDAASAVKRQAGAAAFPSLSVEARAAHYEGLKDTTFGPLLAISAIEDRYAVSISLVQPVYMGGSLTAGWRAAKWRLCAAEMDVAAQRARVALQAWSAYWAWARAKHGAESASAWVRWMEAHDADVGRLRQGGVATENDELSAKVRLEQTRLRQEDAQRAEGLARANLARLTGEDIAEGTRPCRPPAVEDDAQEPEADSIRAALAARGERSGAEMAHMAAVEGVDVQKAGFLPQLVLGARYEQGRPNPLDIPPRDEWQEDAFFGIQLTWNLVDWGLTRGRVAEAEARRAQAEIRREAVEEDIILDVRRARIDLRNARARAAVALQAESAARRNLKTAMDLWKNGLARHADVLDAQARLAEAEYEVIVGGADVAVASAALAFAKGEMQTFLDRMAPAGKDGKGP